MFKINQHRRPAQTKVFHDLFRSAQTAEKHLTAKRQAFAALFGRHLICVSHKLHGGAANDKYVAKMYTLFSAALGINVPTTTQHDHQDVRGDSREDIEPAGDDDDWDSTYPAFGESTPRPAATRRGAPPRRTATNNNRAAVKTRATAESREDKDDSRKVEKEEASRYSRTSRTSRDTATESTLQQYAAMLGIPAVFIILLFFFTPYIQSNMVCGRCSVLDVTPVKDPDVKPRQVKLASDYEKLFNEAVQELGIAPLTLDIQHVMPN